MVTCHCTRVSLFVGLITAVTRHRAVTTTLPAPECFTHRAISVVNIWMRRIDCEAFGSSHPFPERSSVRMRARSPCAPRIIPESGCRGELHAVHAPRGVLCDSCRQGFCSGPVALNTEASYCAADSRWAADNRYRLRVPKIQHGRARCQKRISYRISVAKSPCI